MSRIFSHSLTQVRDLLRAGEISAQDATRACLERIAATEPRLDALLHVAGEEALNQAAAMDKIGPDADKPLWGVPVIIKDVLATAGATRQDAGSTDAASRDVARLAERLDSLVGHFVLKS